MGKKSDEQFTPEEAAERRDAIIKNMIATPPAPRGTLNAKRKPSRTKATSHKSVKKT